MQSENWIEFKKSHMRDRCVISFGLILMRSQDLEKAQEEQDLPLDRMSQRNSTEQTI